MKKFIFTLLFLGIATNCVAENITKVKDKQLYKAFIGVDNDEVIIGDEKDPSAFKNKITFKKWFNSKQGNYENSLTLKVPDGLIASSSPTLSAGKVEIKDTDTGFYFNSDPDNADNFKFGLILYEKPTTNIWTFQLEGWEKFDFFYQPALTQQEIDNGDKRPSDVVRSYAVYHKTKKNHIIGQTNYQTGKFCHIYRPKFIDANGNWVWADLHIENGVYTVTVPQNFLDNAVYPIKANDTFGNTGVGASYGANYPSGGSWNSVLADIDNSAAGTNTLNYITWRLRADATITIHFALYTAGLSRTAITASTFTAASTEAWRTNPTDLNTALAASTNYGAAYYHSSGGTYSEYAYDDNASYWGYRHQGTMDSPWTDTADPITRKASAYATYTPSGAARRIIFTQ